MIGISGNKMSAKDAKNAKKAKPEKALSSVRLFFASFVDQPSTGGAA